MKPDQSRPTFDTCTRYYLRGVDKRKRVQCDGRVEPVYSAAGKLIGYVCHRCNTTFRPDGSR